MSEPVNIEAAINGATPKNCESEHARGRRRDRCRCAGLIRGRAAPRESVTFNSANEGSPREAAATLPLTFTTTSLISLSQPGRQSRST